MGIMEIIGIAGSVSLLAGWRLYLCIFATGLAMRLDVLPLPEHLASLSVLGNPWVLAIAAFGALAEFFADKVMWLDSAWDTLHTLIRPVGGALLALAIVDPSDPATQVVAFLLGGGASFLAHGGKASARAVVNASPEPVSNVVASSAEDVATVGLLWLAYEYPLAAGGIALVLLILAFTMLWLARKIVRRVFFRTPEVGR
ncbi:DUF4126 domain-containing protein [Qipengyuania flava]|uniref:DUF4126 domain-containing protein n=1 Tax=Qipengyuania flava TaxID=192812 RepID=UPI00141B1C64|nr:DUF4126 domain-containing protein [Qipengyuania flava]